MQAFYWCNFISENLSLSKFFPVKNSFKQISNKYSTMKRIDQLLLLVGRFPLCLWHFTHHSSHNNRLEMWTQFIFLHGSVGRTSNSRHVRVVICYVATFSLMPLSFSMFHYSYPTGKYQISNMKTRKSAYIFL